MKKIINIFLFIALCLQFSCDDILNTKPLDKYSEEIIWNDYNLAQGFVYSTYKSVIPLYIKTPGESILSADNDKYSDNMVMSGGVGSISQDLIDKFYDAGWNVFSQIRQCNLIIEKVESSKFTKLQKERLLGEAKMLRAMIYFHQARIFGRFIIIDKVLSPDDNLELPRCEKLKDLYDFIIRDLDDAKNILTKDAETGLLTKGSALALEAEVALHGAAYIETGKEEYYKKTKEASEELFNLNKYELEKDYSSIFNDYNKALNSKEIILAWYQHEDVTQGAKTAMIRFIPNIAIENLQTNSQPKLIESYTGWQQLAPSVELCDDYLVIDKDNVAKKWNETYSYRKYEKEGGYLSNIIYKNRDNRFYASIAYDSTKFFNNIITTRINGNMNWYSNSKGTWGMSQTGYYIRKGVYENITFNPNMYTPYHVVIFRLGRSYLNYAEAMLRLGEKSIAINYINKTRNIHGGLPSIPDNTDISKVWELYKIERRVELFNEGDRFWSLLRWGKEAGDIIIPELNRDLSCFEISEDGRNYKYIPIPNGYATRNEKRFSSRRYLFPVPEKERLLNKKLDQNNGW